MCCIMIMVRLTIKDFLKEAVPMHSSLEQDRLYVTVDLLIMTVREGKLILYLSRREDAPYAGRWALPGRFVDLEESAEVTAGKLLEEMLPVPGPFIEQLYTFTEVSRDPRGRVISAAYLVIVPEGKLSGAPLQEKTKMKPFEARLEEDGLRLTGEDGTVLRTSDLAFDHGRIIETGIIRLQGKIDYTDIGFRFLNDPDAFPLGELQTVFEAVLGTPMDPSNFRRSILGRYEKTGRLTQTEQTEKKSRGRPAALYRFR